MAARAVRLIRLASGCGLRGCVHARRLGPNDGQRDHDANIYCHPAILPHEPLRSGNAKTYSALPFCGWRTSGLMIRGTFLGLPPPRPVVTAMYCRPVMLNVTGEPCTEVPSRVSHNV